MSFFVPFGVREIAKGIWVKNNKGNNPPKTHNLVYLAQHTNLELNDMHLVDRKIMNDVKYFIEQLKKEINIQAVYLFGSYARGKNKDYSDIDVAIVSNSFERFVLADNNKILKVTKDINRMIEPHPFRAEDFTEDNPFVKEIVSTGIKIY